MKGIKLELWRLKSCYEYLTQIDEKDNTLVYYLLYEAYGVESVQLNHPRTCRGTLAPVLFCYHNGRLRQMEIDSVAVRDGRPLELYDSESWKDENRKIIPFIPIEVVHPIGRVGFIAFENGERWGQMHQDKIREWVFT